MNEKIQIEILLRDFFAIFAFSFFLFLPLFISNNWFDGHDGIRFLCLFEQFKAGIIEGVLFPRWLPDNYGGFGYPDFVFYQPGFFYFLLLFSFFIEDTLTLFFISLFILLCLGAFAVYLLARRYYSSLGAVVSALLFTLTPYIYVDIYVRSDLAEFASMMIIPWIFFVIEKFIYTVDTKKILIYFVFCSLLMAILVYTHPFTAMFFFSFCFLIYAFSFFYTERAKAKSAVLFVFFAIFAGISLSAPYWLTAFLMKQYVNYKVALTNGLETKNHLLYISQFFSRFWGFGGSIKGINDEMSFQLGAPHFILAVFGFFCAKDRKFKIIFMIYLLSLFFLLDNQFNRFIWSRVPFINMVQFPWRLLSVISFLQIFSIFPFILRISQIPGKKAMVILLFLPAFFLFYYEKMLYMKTSDADTRVVLTQHRDGRKFIFGSYSSFNEFFPVYIKRHPEKARGNRGLIEVLGDDVVVRELSYSSAYRYSAVVFAKKSQFALCNFIFLALLCL